METIIVELYVPAISSTFDFSIPATGRVCDTVAEIVRILEATQQNLEFDKEMPMLCDLEHGVPLKPNAYIAETGIHDSSRLMLV
ncbi:MAG: hypothetical protein IJ074_11970 [Clostridia bacterium]|nr:hypothetical protein [Clostridia bacterium]MBQ8973779.1 hypothetical protein [Clostridia bacterium]